MVSYAIILSHNGGNIVPKSPMGIPKAVCIVVPSTCVAATPVGAIINTLGFPITTSKYHKVITCPSIRICYSILEVH